MISCSYCRTLNADGESRCRRCGRRLPGGASGTLSDTGTEMRPFVNGALATQPSPVRVRAETTEHEVKTPPGPAQRSLFPPKVIPFESFAGSRTDPRPAPKAPRAPARRQTPRTPENQGSLDFLQAAPQAARKLKTTVEAVIYCDAPVATKMHRAVAAAVDLSMILIAYGIFLLAFHLGGGQFALDKLSLSMFGAGFLLISFFYGLAWALGNTESPGKRWMHLKLVTFEGFPPDASHRLWRFVGACLSYAAGGLGILWAVADEESLTWQDHISKTFLTVETPETNFVRQK